MARFTNLDRHSLYPVEIIGDTLVVSPRGDAAGFNPTAVNHEMATVMELAQSPGVTHLIVDFSGANYFGSIVLGGLVQLTQTVKKRGGRTAICDASQDMQDILRIMKLDALWETFPNRGTALRRIAKIPIQQQLWGMRKPAGILAGLVMLVAAYIFYPRPNYGHIYYEPVHEMMREYQRLQTMAGEEEWRLFTERSTRKMKPMVDHINRRSKAGQMKTSELFLLYIMRDFWPKMIERNSEHAAEATETAQQYLRYVEAEMEGRPISGDMAGAHPEELFKALNSPPKSNIPPADAPRSSSP